MNGTTALPGGVALPPIQHMAPAGQALVRSQSAPDLSLVLDLAPDDLTLTPSARPLAYSGSAAVVTTPRRDLELKLTSTMQWLGSGLSSLAGTVKSGVVSAASTVVHQPMQVVRGIGSAIASAPGALWGGVKGGVKLLGGAISGASGLAAFQTYRAAKRDMATYEMGAKKFDQFVQDKTLQEFSDQSLALNADGTVVTPFTAFSAHTKAKSTRDGTGVVLQSTGFASTVVSASMSGAKKLLEFLAKGKALAGGAKVFAGKAIPGVNVFLGCAGVALSAKQCHREYCKRAQTSERLALLNKVQAEAANNAAATAGTANAEPLNEVLDNVQRHAGARLSRQGTVSVVKMVATAISGISSGITAASGAATLSVVGAPVGVVLSFVAMGVSGLGAAVSAGMGAYTFFSDRSATQQKEAIKDGPALQATLDAIKQEYQVKGNTTATITDDEARAKLAETNRFFAATQFLDQLGAGGSAGEQGKQWLEKLGMPKAEIEHLIMQASADRPVTPSSAAFESACKFLFG